MPILRLAYATQFLIALIAVFTLWSQVGGQSHLDLLPWYVKLVLGVGSALSIVKATAAAVGQEHPWNGRTLKWFALLLLLLLGCGLASDYAHRNLEDEPDDQSDAPTSVGAVHDTGAWNSGNEAFLLAHSDPRFAQTPDRRG